MTTNGDEASRADYARPMNEEALNRRLGELRAEHRQLDDAIEALRLLRPDDQLQLARLKKRKLRLKDEITLVADQVIPDIIA